MHRDFIVKTKFSVQLILPGSSAADSTKSPVRKKTVMETLCPGDITYEEQCRDEESCACEGVRPLSITCTPQECAYWDERSEPDLEPSHERIGKTLHCQVALHTLSDTKSDVLSSNNCFCAPVRFSHSCFRPPPPEW